MDDFFGTLKTNGLRLTHVRETIFLCLKKKNIAMSATEVFKKLGKRSKIDLVSVYRNLDLFEELGLVHRFSDGRFALCCQDKKLNGKNHAHIISRCVSCGNSQEISSHSSQVCELASRFKNLLGSLDIVQEILVQGHCEKCHN